MPQDLSNNSLNNIPIKKEGGVYSKMVQKKVLPSLDEKPKFKPNKTPYSFKSAMQEIYDPMEGDYKPGAELDNNIPENQARTEDEEYIDDSQNDLEQERNSSQLEYLAQKNNEKNPALLEDSEKAIEAFSKGIELLNFENENLIDVGFDKNFKKIGENVGRFLQNKMTTGTTSIALMVGILTLGLAIFKDFILDAFFTTISLGLLSIVLIPLKWVVSGVIIALTTLGRGVGARKFIIKILLKLILSAVVDSLPIIGDIIPATTIGVLLVEYDIYQIRKIAKEEYKKLENLLGAVEKTGTKHLGEINFELRNPDA